VQSFHVVALNKETGETVWKTPRAFDYGTDNGDRKKAYCTPAVFQINGMCADTGVASCVDPKTGDVVWSKRLAKEYAASPLVAEGRIYFFGREGEVHAVKAGREFELLSEGKFDEGFMASPAVIDKSIILRSTTSLYCFDKR